MRSTFINFMLIAITNLILLLLSPMILAASDLGIEAFPRSLIDATGKTLVISSAPQRIVSQTLATDEILLAIGPATRIIALSPLATDTIYSNIVTSVRQLKIHTTNNVEQILSLKPDLILVANYNRAETLELLQTMGAPVLQFTQFDSIQAIENNIRLLGEAIGEEQRAEALITKMKREIEEIRAQFPARLRPLRVLSYSPGNYVAGRHTTFDDMTKIIGVVNIASEQGIEYEAKISDEQILTWQPDVIVTHAATSELAQVREQLLTQPSIAASRAGKAGKIVVIDERHFAAISHYLVKGIRTLALKLAD